MAAGYIKLSRSLLENPIFHNEKLLKIWTWCLLKATYKEHEQLVGLQKIKLQPGQFITGRHVAAKELKLKPSTFWSYMHFLKDNRSIDIKTNNKYSLVTVVNWASYQLDSNYADNKTDNSLTANRQRTNTNKNDKNNKNNHLVPYGTILKYFNTICKSLPEVKKLTDSRKKSIKARWDQMNNSMENMIAFFQRVEASDFMTGRKVEWVANFDWVMKSGNFTKIIEGSYDNRTMQPVKSKTQKGLDDLERLCDEYDRGDPKQVNQYGYCKLSNAGEY